MTLAHPQLLWLLLVVPALIIALALDGQRRRRLLERIGHLPQIRRMTASVSVGRRRLKGFLFIAAIVLAVVALSRPQLPGNAQLLPRRGLDIVVALDFSRSMLATDVYPTRLARAKLELDKLIDGLKGDRVGLVAFAGVTMGYPLTSDYAAAKLFWRDLGPGDIPVGGTNLAGALSDSLDLLARGSRSHARADGDSTPDADRPRERNAAQVIILLTDGADTESPPDAGPIEVAREAAKRGVKIYSVGIGSREGDYVSIKRDDGASDYIRDDRGQPVRMELDEKTLRELASITGGEYFPFDAQRFGVERVQRAIAALERTEEEARVVREPIEAFGFFLLPAFALLVAEGVVSERRKHKKTKLSSITATLILLAFLPGLGGWTGFERPSPEVDDGNRKLAAGKADEALSAYDRAVEQKPDDLAAHYDRGAALYLLKRFPESQREFQRAAESPDPALRADAFYNMGNALMRQQQPKDAIDAYVRTLRLRPDDRRAKWNLELALRMLKEQQQQKKKEQQQDRKDDQQQQQQQAQQDQQQQSQQSGKSDDQQKRQQDQQGQQQGQQQAEQDRQQQRQSGDDSKQQRQAQNGDEKKQQQEQQARREESKDSTENKHDKQRQGEHKRKDQEQQKDQQAVNARVARPPREIDRQDAEAVLDAFERFEPTVQKDLARRKAGGRAPNKDW